MNKNLFRLKFSQRLGMFVPAPETATACTSGKSSSPKRMRRRAMLALLAAGSMQTAMAAPLMGLNPGGGSWTGANLPQFNGNTADIYQTAPKAYLNWLQINLAAGETLNFHQLNSSWSVLNNIHDANPTSILGTINANGNVYLINANGIIFGAGSQVNVGSLYAGSLNITESLFNSGLLSSLTQPVFSGTGGYVWVEEGAAITAATGGRVLLFAPDVRNSGVIKTPQGQTILAAGKEVYLKDSTDPAGLLVEVNGGGTATNLGEIVAKLGNVTMVGLAVNQQGRINASTSVRANGSIYLKAQDTVDTTKLAQSVLQATNGGVVTLGKGSTTSIDIETADKEEIVDTQTLNDTLVSLSGGVINIDGSIVAHGGKVTAVAAFNPSMIGQAKTTNSSVDATRIYVGKDALIDVSGVIADAPMSRNQIAVQLYSEQLKDDPLLRDSSLKGQTVYLDARKGDNGIVDIAPSKALIGKTIAERMSAGGTVTLKAAGGDVILDKGSEINVSGGAINYAAGYIKESNLLYQGKVVSIADANNATPYSGLADVYTVTDTKWGVTRTWNLNPTDKGTFNEAYTAGANAGTVNITGANALLAGDFVANTNPGQTQRQSLPQGGVFNLSLANALNGTAPTTRIVSSNTSVLPDDFSVVGALSVGANNTPKFAVGDALPTALKNEVQLTTTIFSNGFSSLNINPDKDATSANGYNVGAGNVIVDAAITTAPQNDFTGSTGGLTINTAGTVAINQDIKTSGGAVTIKGGAVNVGSGVTISTAGLFTNDLPGRAGAQTAPVLSNAGNISITGVSSTSDDTLVLASDAKIDASAGAWLNASGKLVAGKAGNISLSGIKNVQSGQLSAYGFSKGGQLTLTTQKADVQLGGQAPASGFYLTEGFFNQGGFSAYNIATNTGSLKVGDGTSTLILPQAETLVLNINASNQTSGSNIAQVATPTLLPAAQRTPVSMSLQAFGDLTIENNATIRLDAPATSTATPGSIALTSGGQLSILGDLIAPAGNISATVSGLITNFAYDNTQSVFVGENAHLIATGYYSIPISANGSLANAAVLNGGSINLSGGNRAAVILKEGSVLDVSGVSGQVDVNTASGTSRQTQYGAAGSISLSSRNSLALDGTLLGNAQGTGAGGSLSVQLNGAASGVSDAYAHPNGARTLTVTQNKTNIANGLNAGDALDSLIGQSQISAQQVEEGGFDRLSLASKFSGADNKIVLPAGLQLTLPSELTLDAPLLQVTGNGAANVHAAHVTLTNTLSEAAASPQIGTGALNVSADFIDIINSVAVSGVNTTNLVATQDIRGRGLSSGSGSLTSPGELNLTARQIYPATNAGLTLTATGSGSKINVASNGKALSPVLSAGGQLTLTASSIEQGGLLLAPLGTITLNSSQLTYKNGSLTSTSANGLLIPYGLTALNGINWTAPTGQLSAEGITSGILTRPPEKRIQVNASSVDQQAGATIDISGGGDLLAYEFIKGIGGSTDVLGQGGVFAVMPSLQGQYSPYDYSYNKINSVDADGKTIVVENTLKAGDAVYLSGMSGLPAGVYTLMPARYALLPGAYMLQTSSTGLTQGQNQQLADGSTLVSGYGTVLSGASRDAAYSTYKLTSGDIFRPAAGTVSKAPSEYKLSTGNAFFSTLATDAGLAIPRLAQDAGQLVFNTTDNLLLNGTVLTNKRTGARGALVDITSGNISVVSSTGASDGSLQLTASSLNNLNAESLLLGGTRSQGTDGSTTITSGATTVKIKNDADHALEVTELILAASDTIDIQAGANIKAATSTQTPTETVLHASGDGALFAISSLHDFNYDRANVNQVTGTLNITSGAEIHAGRSVVLDATKAASLEGTVQVNEGGNATFGANRLLLGNAGAVSGLQLNNDLLASLGNLSKITFNSYSNLDIYGGVNLGNSNLDLTINAAGIAGHLNGGDTANLTARNLVIKNSTGAVFTSVSNVANTTLNLDAKNITLAGAAPNTSGTSTATNTTIAGFDNANLNAKSEVVFTGVNKTQVQASNTTIKSSRIAASTGADSSLTATGNLTTGLIDTPETLSTASGLGAKVGLTGANVALGGVIELPSGQLTANSTQGDLTVVSGASIKAQSVPVVFDKVTAYTPGGTINLQSDLGSVIQQSGSTLDVSATGSGNTANAGTLNVTAKNGSVDLGGTLNGQATTGTKGNFNSDSKTLTSFSDLNTALNAGGFSNSRNLRVRTGDVTIAQGDTVTAQQFVLSADAGSINVSGTVDASGVKAGSIGLYANQTITLNSTAQLNAKATAAGNDGGKVEVAVSGSTSTLDFKSGSKIDVSAGTGGKGGEIHLRAPRNTANTDINITALAGNMTGASSIQAEAFKTYTNVSNIATANFSTSGTWYTEAVSFMRSALVNNGVGLQRLGKTGDALFTIVPGLDLINTAGNLTLANDWGLQGWRFDPVTGVGVTNTTQLANGLNANGQQLLGGVLTLRATGNLTLNGTLSDGFNTTTLTTANAAQGLQSWGYNLVAGADTTAANYMATIANSSSGNITLANAKGVRTGTGDIKIAAGGNLTLGNDSSVIYTAGRKASVASAFTQPTNSLYLTDGGDLDINVQGNITGQTSTNGAQQTVNQWLFRQGGGSTNKQVSWWLRPDLFKAGAATFGGGDINIQAGGTITNFSAAAPTTEYTYALTVTDPDTSIATTTTYQIINGGGNIAVQAKQDILSGLYFAGQGEIDLSAGGQISSAPNTFGTTIALQNASAQVSAIKSVLIESVFNPTLWAQATANVSNALATNGDSSFFMTYGSNSALRANSLIGDVTLAGNQAVSDGSLPTNASFNVSGKLATGLNSGTTSARTALELSPGTVEANAFNGNINIGRLVLTPSANGNLSLLAAGNIKTATSGLIAMSDADAQALSLTTTSPLIGSTTLGTALLGLRTNFAASPLHTGDDQPLTIISRDGSITLIGDIGSSNTQGPGLSSAKAVYVSAGQDLSINTKIQHTSANDISVLRAGRDFTMPLASNTGVQVAGPGELLVTAGRNVSLGTTRGITSVANSTNSALPSSGASITVLAGLGEKGAEVEDYVNTYINPTGAGPSVLQGDGEALDKYRAQTTQSVTSYMKKLSGDDSLSDADAMTQFLAMDADKQAVFVYRHFSSELLASGKAYAETGNQIRGDSAIAMLFPSLNNYNGDVSLFNSQINTLRDGSIDILAPGGLINVGVPTSSGNNIGMVTQQGGAIRAFAESGFQVEQSRVITQYGSDITVWVNNGDIDAGRGSKTALTIPTRTVSTDVDGNTTVTVQGVAAGSGIRAQTYDPDGPSGSAIAPTLGSVALIAPRGILNASEAGIAAGNFLAVATQVIGANNISVSGTSTGVPAADTGGLAGSLAGVSNAASSATKSAGEEVARQLQQAATAFNAKDFLPSIVSVEVIGLGL